MIDWQASKILISFYKTNFLSFIGCHYGFPKNFKITKFSLSQSPPGTEKVQQISELWIEYKKSYWDSKMQPSCLNHLVLLTFNLWCQLRGVITFEWVINLCWNFQDNIISYIPFMWKSFIKILDGSCPALVHLTWNEPLFYFEGLQLWRHFLFLQLQVSETILQYVLYFHSSLKISSWIFLFKLLNLNSLTLKRHNSFQNWNNRKAPHVFVTIPLIFKLQQEVLKFNDDLRKL